MNKTISNKQIFSLSVFLVVLVNSHAQRPPAITSPLILPDHRVTLSLYAPMATSVELTGSWLSNPFSGEQMTIGENGIWTYTTNPLGEDLYMY